MLSVLMMVLTSFGSANQELQYLIAIRPAYKEICSECRFEFSEVRVSSSLKTGLDKAVVKTDSLKWGQSFLLPLEIEGQNVGWVSGRVKILKLGLRALKAIPQNQTLRADDFRPDWIDITLSKDQPAQTEDLQSVDARRFISVRDPLMKGDLKKSQLVTRGQIINVIAGSDAFTVSTQMRAEEAGGFGDLIRVKGTDSQKVLSVRVQNDGSGRFE